MADAHVERWKKAGRIVAWRYRGRQRHYPGVHLAADAEGCDALIDLIDRMRATPRATRVSMGLDAPTERDVAVPNAGLPWRPVRTLTINYQPDGADAQQWSLRCDGDAATIVCGMLSLDELRAGAEDMKSGGGDWGIGGAHDDDALTFWWPARER